MGKAINAVAGLCLLAWSASVLYSAYKGVQSILRAPS